MKRFWKGQKKGLEKGLEKGFEKVFLEKCFWSFWKVLERFQKGFEKVLKMCLGTTAGYRYLSNNVPRCLGVPEAPKQKAA